jgi:hypothetical protein
MGKGKEHEAAAKVLDAGRTARGLVCRSFVAVVGGEALQLLFVIGH